jgi:hypothetical protein
VQISFSADLISPGLSHFAPTVEAWTAGKKEREIKTTESKLAIALRHINMANHRIIIIRLPQNYK